MSFIESKRDSNSYFRTILCFSLIINGKADRRTDRWTDRRTEYGRRDILTEVFTEENMDLHSLYTISRKLRFKTSFIRQFSPGVIVCIFLYLGRFLATLTPWLGDKCVDSPDSLFGNIIFFHETRRCQTSASRLPVTQEGLQKQFPQNAFIPN